MTPNNVFLLLQEVCSQIWATLYDYPGLKTCDGLIKYIKECVRTAWGLTNQVRQKSLFIELAFWESICHVVIFGSEWSTRSDNLYLSAILKLLLSLGFLFFLKMI